MDSNVFDGLADNYQKARPGYPLSQLNRIKDTVCANNRDVINSALVLDIGSGTGISTRLLRETFDVRIPVIGIEPGEDMREKAISYSVNLANLSYVNGQAGNICFNNGTADLILAAQAIHWFDRAAFYREAARVLKQGGVLAVMQNNTNWPVDPFLSEYEIFLEHHNTNYSRYYRSFDIAAELQNLEKLQFAGQYNEAWSREMTKDDFIAAVNSTTKYHAAVLAHGQDYMDGQLRQIIEKYYGDSTFLIEYICELYLAIKI